MGMSKEFRIFIRFVLLSIPATLFSIVGIVVWFATLGHEKHLLKIVAKMIPDDEKEETREIPKTISESSKTTLMTEGFKAVWLFVWGVVVAVIFGMVAMILFIPSLGHSWKIFNYGADYMDKLLKPNDCFRG